MRKQSLAKNFIFQILYQGLIFLIPIILSPYLTRTLRETSLGIYSYVNSIAYYFVVAGMLGISRHGQRVISTTTHNEIELRKTFWSLYIDHITVAFASTILYLLFVLLIVGSDKDIFYIEGIYVLSAAFDITWLYYGLENFQNVVIKNTVIKVLECALIFMFVKSPTDLQLYTFIVAGGTLIGHIVIFPQAVKMIKPIRVSIEDCKAHIKPLLLFSIAVIASSLYVVFDKTLLGIMTTKENVAFYEYSNRIINVPKTIVAVIGTVMFPRACRYAAEGNYELQKKYIHYSVIITALISFGSIFGILAVSDVLSFVYYGESFYVCTGIMCCLSPLVYIVGLGDIIRSQYMIPNKMDKEFNFCIVLNAVINLILSTLLIPLIGMYGAVIGTLSAELFGLIYQIFLCRKSISVISIIRTSAPYTFAGIVMYCILVAIKLNLTVSLKSLLLLIGIGAFLYVVMCGLYIIVAEKDLWKSIKKEPRETDIT